MKAIYARKIVFRLSVFFLVLSVFLYLLSAIFGYFEVPNWIFLVLGILYLFIAVFVYYQAWIRPLDKILIQIRMLLSDRKYKKILTNRIDEIGVIAHFFNQMTDIFEKVSEEIRLGERVTGELKTAGQLQKELIPNTAPSITGLDIAVKNRSAEELGGDNFDFITVGQNNYIYVGDVTGHGIPAAIVMTMVNTLINTFSGILDSAFEIVKDTNTQLKKRIRSTMFMSMIFLKWDSLNRKMTYVGCGHEYIIIYRAKTGQVEVQKSGGIALGMIADNSKIIKELDLSLDIGDMVVLYTDGITEARNMEGEMFGLERLQQSVEKNAGQGDSQSLIQTIAREFSKFVEDHVQEDDVTLIVIKKLGETEKAKSFMDQKVERWNTKEEKDAGIADSVQDQSSEVKS